MLLKPIPPEKENSLWDTPGVTYDTESMISSHDCVLAVAGITGGEDRPLVPPIQHDKAAGVLSVSVLLISPCFDRCRRFEVEFRGDLDSRIREVEADSWNCDTLTQLNVRGPGDGRHTPFCAETDNYDGEAHPAEDSRTNTDEFGIVGKPHDIDELQFGNVGAPRTVHDILKFLLENRGFRSRLRDNAECGEDEYCQPPFDTEIRFLLTIEQFFKMLRDLESIGCVASFDEVHAHDSEEYFVRWDVMFKGKALFSTLREFGQAGSEHSC